MNPFRLSGFFNLSVRVGRLFGIPIHLHITILFFLWPAFARRGVDLGLVLEWVVGIVLSILLHELGHALTAKRYGMTGLSIMLHGFGGFASSSGPRSPRQSLVISLAGPAVTFAIGIFGLIVGTLGQNTTEFASTAWIQFGLLHALGALNILLGFLNLVPSLPWDGGQALQAILAHRMSPIKATRAVAHLGLILCPVLFIYGLTSEQNYFGLFSLVGFLTSYSTLASTGGIRFGEVFADRRARREMEAVRLREEARTETYLTDVNARQKEREERERLRKLFGDSGIDEE